MSIKSWLRSATWPLRQFIVRSIVWFQRGVKEALIGLVGVTFVAIIAYSAVRDVSLMLAVSEWATLFDDMFGLLSVAVEVLIFGGLVNTGRYIQKQERVGKIGFVILLAMVLALFFGIISFVPGGLEVPAVI